MATLTKKGRKKAEENGEAAPMALPETTSEMVEAPPEEPHYSPPPSGYSAARTMGRNEYDPAPDPGPAGDYTPPTGAGDFQLPERYIPAEPPPSREPPAARGGLLNRVLMFTGEQTAAERDRIAQEEFQQAIEPVMEYMRTSIPEASTPEEAERILSQNQGEIIPDPDGGAYVYGDAFDADARVYYRLLRRDYEKNPRPSERRSVSHHLHGIYGKLTGTKGW